MALKAARSGDAEKLAALLAGGADANEEGTGAHRPLHECALNSSTSCLALLLAHPTTAINAIKHADWTALHLACTRSSVEVVRMLVAAGADIHLRNKDGWTCFHVACKTGDAETIKYLLSLDPKFWSTEAKNKRTPLMTACLYGHQEAVELILSLGGEAALNLRDSTGCTALHSAVTAGHASIVRVLVAAGADIWAKDSIGRCILHAAAQAGDGGVFFTTSSEQAEETLLHLIELMGLAGVNAEDNARSTPLHLAASENHPGSVRLLLKHGAIVDAVNTHGRTPLILAATFSRAQAVALLLDAGANPLISDAQGHTALHLARREDIRQLLTASQAQAPHDSSTS
eukprot:m.130385 g.130385  ORF g.130385 m.130385 type:complete len:344 (+) comp52345_c0_seq10:26-1057(+)